MGVEREWTRGALRMSLGHTSSQADVDRAVDVVVDAVTRLRRAGSVRAGAAVRGVAST
jgi:cysteine desulfurase